MTKPPVLPLFLKFFLPLAALLLAGLLMFGKTQIQSEMTRLKSQLVFLSEPGSSF